MKIVNGRFFSVLLASGILMSTLSGCVDDGSLKSGIYGESGGKSVLLATDDSTDLFVRKVDKLPEDFALGMDASSVLAEENSGVKYYDFKGKEADPFRVLHDSGINYIRLRVWNDPYDANGNGYGGGNNDVKTAVELGKRATENGMKVCVDFHYSDFWSDPKRQHAPKAWEGMSVDEKADALYVFTKESLTQMLDAGIDVGMVQVGNEINNGISGVSMLTYVAKLVKAGSKAVREISALYDKDIKIVVHYANIDNVEDIDGRVSSLRSQEVDYDILGMSYYPFWDCDFERLKKVLSHVKYEYGKDVMLAETSYPYTLQDGDGQGNSVAEKASLVEGYPASVQGQANMIRDTIAAVNEIGAVGVFYWEGTWIPVGPQSSDNSELWEVYGSGWASSFSADYDPQDAGLYYGGCSWENQALFDFNGHPLDSLNVYKYLWTGHKTELKVEDVPIIRLSFPCGGEIKLPEEVDVIYNDNSVSEKVPVTWNEEQLKNIDVTKESVTTVKGKITDDVSVTCYIKITSDNYVDNPSFEEPDKSMWKISHSGAANPCDYQDKVDDAHTGTNSFHFWSESDMDFSIQQVITNLSPGTYKLTAYAQGGDMDGLSSKLELYAISGDKEQTKDFMVTSWAEWKQPTIDKIEVTDGTVIIGVRAKCNGGSWGTVDDFSLTKVN
ncbi:MAG: glycosyl hydrolase 53 family protein [Butyrivibrio sp.]|nr:glycosyl hydrolase 53 family protein [Butyrivibrio sp.]